MDAGKMPHFQIRTIARVSPLLFIIDDLFNQFDESTTSLQLPAAEEVNISKCDVTVFSNDTMDLHLALIRAITEFVALSTVIQKN